MSPRGATSAISEFWSTGSLSSRPAKNLSLGVNQCGCTPARSSMLSLTNGSVV